jgi:hypothetical protein
MYMYSRRRRGRIGEEFMIGGERVRHEEKRYSRIKGRARVRETNKVE